MDAIKDVNKSKYRKAINDYYSRWQLTDSFLRSLCVKEYSLHVDENIVNAKVLIIGRTFASGIERQVRILKKKENRRQGEAIDKLTRYIYNNGKEIDCIISSINQCAKFDEKSIVQICEGHAKLCNILKTITRTSKNHKKHIPISFASKYLHFHCPIVPIYDSFASYQVWNMVEKYKLPSLERPVICYSGYYDYCRGILAIYNELVRTKAVPKPTARYAEYYVMWSS